MSWSRLAIASLASGAQVEGATALRRGQAVMAALARVAPDNPEWKQSLDWFNEQIAALPK